MSYIFEVVLVEQKFFDLDCEILVASVAYKPFWQDIVYVAKAFGYYVLNAFRVIAWDQAENTFLICRRSHFYDQISQYVNIRHCGEYKKDH